MRNQNIREQFTSTHNKINAHDFLFLFALSLFFSSSDQENSSIQTVNICLHFYLLFIFWLTHHQQSADRTRKISAKIWKRRFGIIFLLSLKGVELKHFVNFSSYFHVVNERINLSFLHWIVHCFFIFFGFVPNWPQRKS